MAPMAPCRPLRLTTSHDETNSTPVLLLDLLNLYYLSVKWELTMLLRQALLRSCLMGNRPCARASTSLATAQRTLRVPAVRTFSTQHDFDPEESVGKSLPEESDGTTTDWRAQHDIKERRRAVREPVQIQRIVDGPPTRFGTGSVANLTEASVIGTAGKTVVLSTVAMERENDQEVQLDSLPKAISYHCLMATSMAPLTVTFQERHHGVGRIPSSARRRDNMRSTDDEILASRAIDRALRPLLKSRSGKVHITCSVQAHDLWGTSGNPVALALNSASIALSQAGLMQEPVACVHLCCMEDGTVVMDPTPKQVEVSLAELLYAGTADKVVMMECSSPTDRIPEGLLVDLIDVAHAALEPVFDIQSQLVTVENEESDERLLRIALGLPPLDEAEESKPTTVDYEEHASALVEAAYEYCSEKLKESALRLFGYTDEHGVTTVTKRQDVSIHPLDQPLLAKAVRGKREHLIFREIERLLKGDFTPQCEQLNEMYQSIVEEDDAALSTLARAIHKRLLQSALADTVTMYNSRGDGREGGRVIRPISLTVPALPDVVHGSAIFARGDTQVLCTSTLGAPRDGIRKINPYQETTDPRDVGTGRPKGPYDDLPVGSLRYLRSQEALVSDMNSAKIKADREMTGGSGTFDETQRFFLHYDFPSFSTGELPGIGMAANRRAIGHGTLAEKGLRSTIPLPEEFPYTIRVTSEVLASNGSSSMATVCGATLALLDAGVPIAFPVAAVSIGFASNSGDETEQDPSGLLIDITGTEDHYGAMDFKIAGTRDGVTALQLDVKRPLPKEVIAEALSLAKDGRRALLKEMNILSRKSSCGIIWKLTPRDGLKESAPRVAIVRFDPLRKRDLIGPGGAVLRQLEDRFGASLDLTQEGRCLLFGADQEMVTKAKNAVMELVADVEEGEVYEGTVIEIKDFGAIIELLRNKEGLLHVSELSDDLESHPSGNLGIVGRHLVVGEKIEVMCTGVDPVQGSIRLSRKELLRKRKR